jgi:hypothetical protein
MRVLPASACFFIAALRSLSAVELSDEQLREKIVGVWYCEALRDTLHHNGGRLQYFPDGLFIADYRISSPGLEAMHISGFRPNSPGPGPVSWRLDGRVVQAAIDSAKKK